MKKSVDDMLLEFHLDDLIDESRLLTEVSVKDMERMLFNKKTAIISPYRGELGKGENKRRLAQFMRELQALNLRAFKQKGFWEDDPTEISFIIPGMKWSDAVRLGKERYEQDAIIYSLGNGFVALADFRTGKVYWASSADIYADPKKRAERRKNQPGRAPSQLRNISVDLDFNWDVATPLSMGAPPAPPKSMTG